MKCECVAITGPAVTERDICQTVGEEKKSLTLINGYHQDEKKMGEGVKEKKNGRMREYSKERHMTWCIVHRNCSAAYINY